MPKEPAAGTTRQPPKRQPPAHKPAPAPVQTAGSSQGELVQRALADPAALSPADVAALQRAVGNRAVQRLFADPPKPPDNPDPGLVIQTKLVVGSAHDGYEQEADRVARGVMGHLNAAAGPRVQRLLVSKPGTEDINYEDDEFEEGASRLSLGRGTSLAERTAEAEGERPAGLRRQTDDDTHSLRRQVEARPARPIGMQGGAVDHELESTINRSRGGGHPLHGGLRASMEDAFQADFSKVRVHSNHQADSLNRKLSARAFTTGQDLFFKSGEYNPHSTAGKSLLAHELTHVVQQNGSSVRRKPNRDVRRAYAAPVRARTSEPRAQREVGYFGRQREEWKGMNTAAKVAMVPGGALYGGGKAVADTYGGLYSKLAGKDPSGWRKFAAGLGAGVLGTLALPFSLGYGALRGAASGLANPLISLGKRLGGVPAAARGAVGSYSARGGLGSEFRDEQGLSRGSNYIAPTSRDLAGYTTSGLGAAAATGGATANLSSGIAAGNPLAHNALTGSALTGATTAVGALGGAAGILGAGTAVLDAREGLREASDSSLQTQDRGYGVARGLSSLGDAVKQSSTAAFNIATVVGKGTAAAGATLVAGGAGVVMGAIDLLRGAFGARMAGKRKVVLDSIVENASRSPMIDFQEQAMIVKAARDAGETQNTRKTTGIVTAVKGAVTIAGGALLLASAATPIGWALLAGAAVIGGIYALYKLKGKSRRKRQVAVRELGIKNFRDSWKRQKKAIEERTRWEPMDRRRLLKRLGPDPLQTALAERGFSSPAHFYARYIQMTSDALYESGVVNGNEDTVKLLGAMGLKVNKENSTPNARRIAQALDN